MWRAILIDDEEIALDVMEIKLREVGGVEVVGRFQMVTEALRQCADLQPDLIFLDIEMPGMSGLVAADSLSKLCPEAGVIFVTAHDQYAVDAFDTHAVGYVLKPVAKEKLLKALARYSDTRSTLRPSVATVDHEATERPKLRLHVLGSLELHTADGRLLTWRTRKTKELFALLWHYRGERVYKYKILEWLWPEDPADRAQKLLHTTLYYMRSLFKTEGYEDIVRYGDERYWIDSDIFRSDLQDLLALLDNDMDMESKISRLPEVYKGGYLETEHYGWADRYRVELGTSVIAALNGLLNSPKPRDAKVEIAILRKLIELEPDQEHRYDRLAVALERSGDREEAARVRLEKQRMMSEEKN